MSGGGHFSQSIWYLAGRGLGRPAGSFTARAEPASAPPSGLRRHGFVHAAGSCGVDGCFSLPAPDYEDKARIFISSSMRRLASQIEHELESQGRTHCAIYENELQRVWPLNQENREAMIAQFAKEYGFRVRFYKQGLCAIFDKPPPSKPPQRE